MCVCVCVCVCVCLVAEYKSNIGTPVEREAKKVKI